MEVGIRPCMKKECDKLSIRKFLPSKDYAIAAIFQIGIAYLHEVLYLRT